MAFDLEGAKKAGYSDDEIADFLASEKKFDIQGARSSGYSSGDIIKFLSENKEDRKSVLPEGKGNYLQMMGVLS